MSTSVIPKNVPKPPFLPSLYINVFIGQSGERLGYKQYNQPAYEKILAVFIIVQTRKERLLQEQVILWTYTNYATL